MQEKTIKCLGGVAKLGLSMRSHSRKAGSELEKGCAEKIQKKRLVSFSFFLGQLKASKSEQ